MSRNAVPLTIALPPYHHVNELRSAGVDLAGVDASFVDPRTPDADVFELPLLDHLVAREAGDDRVTALPVFLSRRFVHSWIHVRNGGPELVEPDPTASVYARGILLDMGETADVVVAPPAALRGVEGVRPLFARPAVLERQWLAATQVFPILRVLCVRTELLRSHRWLGSNLYRAFEVARRRYFARLEDIRGSRVPIPSAAAHLRRLRETFGGEAWSYGVEPNRPTLQAFLRYAAAQEIAVDGADVAELFAPVEPFVDFTDGV